jgi:hypothetical protein
MIIWVVVASSLWGFPGTYRLVILVILGCLAAAAVVFAARNLSGKIWIVAGAVSLQLLSLPDPWIGGITAHLPSPLDGAITLELFLVIPTAIVVAGLLANSGLNTLSGSQAAKPGDDVLSPPSGKRSTTAPAAVLALSLILLCAVLRTTYRFLVWDTTYDPLGILWLGMPILSILFSSALLFGLLPGKTKLAGVPALLLIPLLIIVAARAQAVDFRHLTEANAERVSQLLEAYFVGEGGYPEDLNQLVPSYAISLPRPVIIFGQSWCYQAGQDYYRLGYLDREHWSSPILFGRMYSAQGHSPLRVDVCQPAIDAYRALHPNWDRTLQDYGKITPTPDI